MKKNQSASGALWTELETVEAYERGAVLADLFIALVDEESADRFSVGQAAIGELLEVHEYELAFEIAQQLGQQLTAEERFDECNEIALEMFELEHHVERDVAGLLRWQYAHNLLQSEHYSDAVQAYSDAFETFTEADVESRAHLLQSRALCLTHLDRWEDAAALLNDAIALFESEGVVIGVGNCKRELGIVQLQLELVEESAATLFDAIQIFTFLGWSHSIQKCELNRGRALSEIGEFQDAEIAFSRASELRDTDACRATAIEALFYSVEITVAQGRTEEARRTYAELVPLLKACGNSELAETALELSAE